jgi:hypothetical protein
MLIIATGSSGYKTGSSFDLGSVADGNIIPKAIHEFSRLINSTEKR